MESCSSWSMARWWRYWARSSWSWWGGFAGHMWLMRRLRVEHRWWGNLRWHQGWARWGFAEWFSMWMKVKKIVNQCEWKSLEPGLPSISMWMSIRGAMRSRMRPRGIGPERSRMTRRGRSPDREKFEELNLQLRVAWQRWHQWWLHRLLCHRHQQRRETWVALRVVTCHQVQELKFQKGKEKEEVKVSVVWALSSHHVAESSIALKLVQLWGSPWRRERACVRDVAWTIGELTRSTWRRMAPCILQCFARSWMGRWNPTGLARCVAQLSEWRLGLKAQLLTWKNSLKGWTVESKRLVDSWTSINQGGVHGFQSWMKCTCHDKHFAVHDKFSYRLGHSVVLAVRRNSAEWSRFTVKPSRKRTCWAAWGFAKLMKMYSFTHLLSHRFNKIIWIFVHNIVLSLKATKNLCHVSPKEPWTKTVGWLSHPPKVLYQFDRLRPIAKILLEWKNHPLSRPHIFVPNDVDGCLHLQSTQSPQANPSISFRRLLRYSGSTHGKPPYPG